MSSELVDSKAMNYKEFLSERNLHFFKFIQDNDLLDSLNFTSSYTLNSKDNYPISSWPQFVSKSLVNDLTDCIVNVPQLLLKLIKHVCEYESEWFERTFTVDVDLLKRTFECDILDSLCCRFNLVVTAQNFKVLELNSGASIGGWHMRFHEQSFKEIYSFRLCCQKYQCSAYYREPLKYLIYSLDRCVNRLGNYDPNKKYNIIFS